MIPISFVLLTCLFFYFTDTLRALFSVSLAINLDCVLGLAARRNVSISWEHQLMNAKKLTSTLAWTRIFRVLTGCARDIWTCHEYWSTIGRGEMSQHERRFNCIGPLRAWACSTWAWREEEADQDARVARCVINRSILRPFNWNLMPLCEWKELRRTSRMSNDGEMDVYKWKRSWVKKKKVWYLRLSKVPFMGRSNKWLMDWDIIKDRNGLLLYDQKIPIKSLWKYFGSRLAKLTWFVSEWHRQLLHE